jgi:dihydroneopterin aldolase
MRFYAYHGALPAENEIGQIFVVDVTLKVNLEALRNPYFDLIERLIAHYVHAQL